MHTTITTSAASATPTTRSQGMRVYLAFGGRPRRGAAGAACSSS